MAQVSRTTKNQISIAVEEQENSGKENAPRHPPIIATMTTEGIPEMMIERSIAVATVLHPASTLDVTKIAVISGGMPRVQRGTVKSCIKAALE